MSLKIFLLPHRPAHSKNSDNNSGADKTEEAVGVDVENFLRDDVSIKTHPRESYPIDNFRWFCGHIHETPDGEEGDNRVDDESEVGEGDAGDHCIWMDDDIGTLKCSIDVTRTTSDDSSDWMEELVGSVTQVRSVSECYESEYEDESIFLFHVTY